MSACAETASHGLVAALRGTADGYDQDHHDDPEPDCHQHGDLHPADTSARHLVSALNDRVETTTIEGTNRCHSR